MILYKTNNKVILSYDIYDKYDLSSTEITLQKDDVEKSIPIQEFINKWIPVIKKETTMSIKLKEGIILTEEDLIELNSFLNNCNLYNLILNSEIYSILKK